jgi:DNA-binding response OmpR family regulator
MERPLAGRSILVVEDEPLIALDVAQALERAGALVLRTGLMGQALALAERDDLSAAVLDHAVGEEDSTPLCARLKERNIPFAMYTGRSRIKGACEDGAHILKPADPIVIVRTVAGLLQSTPTAHKLQ